jgi:tryptophanyl-tRNA synthetase
MQSAVYSDSQRTISQRQIREFPPDQIRGHEEQTMSDTQTRKRILTGDRPTGKLHLGHFVGSHRHRLALQDQYECFFLIADLHMLTTKPDKDSILAIADNARAIIMDHLAIGIDPAKATFFLQSAIHETYELQLLISSLITVERLMQLPTIKDMAAAAEMEQIPYNLLGYPVLQAADILLPRANLVPVGKDNESHVELTRQIARRFNNAYGEVFPMPDPYVVGGTLVGTDGQAKMSKSLDNAIFLSDDEAAVRRRVNGMFTDPNRVSADVPGRVDGNPVFIYHDFFNPNKAEVDDLKQRYQTGKVGDVEVKEKLARALNNFLDPMRERRARYEAQTGIADELLYEGTIRAREEAKATLYAAKQAMGLTGVWNRISRSAERRRKKSEATV